MKKLVTLASAGVFLLSLQGLTLAQEKAPAPAPVAPPAIETPAASKAETAAPEAKQTKKAKKSKKAKSKKAKKTKKTKKPKTTEE
jgi:hypothetical protein